MESLAKHLSEATVYLGRQPIYGANRDIRAYELLYRGAASDITARFRDADQASQSARELIYFMQSEVSRIMLAHGPRRDQPVVASPRKTRAAAGRN